MRQILISFLTLSALLTSCSSDKKSISDKDILEIKMTLENLSLANMKYWEPPFPEDKFIQAFTQSDDFTYISDGHLFNDFEEWKTLVHEFMEEDRVSHKHYTHIIKDIQTTVLSENSGIVTINYIGDFITNDDLHYNIPATVTSVYRFEDNDWKIINEHVSHRKKVLLEK